MMLNRPVNAYNERTPLLPIERAGKVSGGLNNFKDQLLRTAASLDAGETEKRPKENSAMSMEEYKEKIHRMLSEMPVHARLEKTNISVDISEAAFERMKNDPAYEQRMLDLVRRDLNIGWDLGSAPPSDLLINIGANESEYRSTSLNASAETSNQKKVEEAFWEQRARKREKRRELQLEQTKHIAAQRKENWSRRLTGKKELPIQNTMSVEELLSGLL